MKLSHKSLGLSVVFGINALIQLINQIAITHIFGASNQLEVFWAAVALPTVVISAIYATLNDAFLPLYGKRLVKTKTKAKEFLEQALGTITGITTIIALVIIGLAEPISKLLYSSRSELFVAQVANELRWLAIGIPIATIAVIGGSVYYTHKKFFRFPLMQLAGNSVILLSLVSLYRIVGARILVGSFLASLILQAWYLFPKKIRKLRFNLKQQKQLLDAWWPIIVGFFLFRSENIIIKYFAGLMPQGNLVYLSLASKFFMMATGVATIGLQILLLPNLVEMLNKRERIREGFDLIKKTKLMGIAIASLISVGVWWVTPWVLKLLFIGGKFTQTDVEKVSKLLKWFVIPAIGWGIYPLFLQPLIALGQQKKVALIASLASSVALIVGWLSFNQDMIPQTMSLTLTSLMLTGIILGEVLWQKEKRKLLG